jgi:uncharacterized FAD-dependent dehydrogenase
VASGDAMSDSKKIDYIQERVDSVAESMANIDKGLALQKAALETHTKQDENMYEELRRMNDILQLNTESLKEHMGNNVLLKDMLHNMNKRLEPIEVDFIQKTAVREWVLKKAKFTGKVAGAIVAIVGLWMYLQPLLIHLFK